MSEEILKEVDDSADSITGDIQRLSSGKLIIRFFDEVWIIESKSNIEVTSIPNDEYDAIECEESF